MKADTKALLEEKIHRTWLELLIESDQRDIAAIAVETDVEVVQVQIRRPGALVYGNGAVVLHLPVSLYHLVKSNWHIESAIWDTIINVVEGHLDVAVAEAKFELRVKLQEPEEEWKNVVRRLIARKIDPNQGTISELMLPKQAMEPVIHNGMKFASKTEIKIAMELEARRVLFFPLPLAVRAETGEFYRDHREPDFLVCDQGAWGILEVSFHQGRYEKDSEKDIWFKKSGILCIQHYTAERCYNHPAEVVDEFLEILAKYR